MGGAEKDPKLGVEGVKAPGVRGRRLRRGPRTEALAAAEGMRGGRRLKRGRGTGARAKD